MTVNKKIGYNINKRIAYRIYFTYYNDALNPTVTGPKYVLNTAELTQFHVLGSGTYDVHSIEVTNAQGTYNPTNRMINITNAVGPVTVQIKAKYKAVGQNMQSFNASLYLHGAHGVDVAYGWKAALPKSGTISYTNVFGETTTLDIASYGWTMSREGNSPNSIAAYCDSRNIPAIKPGSDVVITSLKSQAYNANGGWRVRIYRDKQSDPRYPEVAETLVDTSSTRITYTVSGTYLTEDTMLDIVTTFD